MENTKDTPTGIPVHGKGLTKTRANSLHTPALLGRNPLIGLLMVITGLGAFWMIAASLKTNGALIRADLPLANSTHQIALESHPIIQALMIFGFYLGEHVIFLIGVFLAIYFVRKRLEPEMVMVVIAWAGEGLMWMILSQAFNRARPVFDVAVFHKMTSPGFPSGHAISAVMCFGLLAYLLVPKTRSGFRKAVIIVLAVLAILFIGASRVFMGDHYLSDVLAGYALGIAWSGLVYTAVELIYQKRINQNVQEK